MNQSSLFVKVLDCLETDDSQLKVNKVNACYNAWSEGTLLIDKTAKIEVKQLLKPGRPQQPELVPPRLLPRRRLSSIEGKAALLHAVCHIEFNAINLALDAVYRFQDLPEQYYSDWLKIAAEEAKHFMLLKNYLVELGYDYGSFVAHNGLWELAVSTDYDILARMALVPRIMEARGLDVTPSIIEKFNSIGDTRAVEILSVIYQEEQGHVQAGNDWFKYICNRRGLEPISVFRDLITRHVNGQIRLPIVRQARLDVGFTHEELDMLENIAQQQQQ